MTEWFYKVIPTKASYEHTRLLAKKDGFVWRPAHTKNEAPIAESRGPAVGDVIHFYCAELRRTPRALGSFEIVETDGHQHEAWFGARVEETALFRVTNPGFAGQLRTFGDYKEDPVFKEFTGWLVKPVTVKAPLLPPAMVLSRTTQLIKRQA